MPHSRRLRRSAHLLLLAPLVMAGTLFAGGPVAHADDGTGESEAIVLAQAPLDDAADAIEAAVEASPAWQLGYGGLAEEPLQHLVTVYWKGTSGATVASPPAAFSQLVARLNNGTSVKIRVAVSKYSRAELIKQAETLVARGGTRAVAIAPDGAGLNVETAGGGLAATRVATNPYVLSSRTAAPIVSTVAVRQNDASASPGRKAGARIYVSGAGGCSTGFSMTDDGSNYELTAAHCGKSGKSVVDGGDDTIGTTSKRNVGIDTMRIKVSHAAPRMYVGAWNSKSGSYKNVVSTVGSAKGSYVCTSGSYTGTNCDLKITDSHYLYALEDGVWRWGVKATRQANVRALGKGDSGGPVLKNTSRSSDVRAAGIISAGQTSVDCGSSSASSSCFRTVIYMRISKSLAGGKLTTA